MKTKFFIFFALIAPMAIEGMSFMRMVEETPEIQEQIYLRLDPAILNQQFAVVKQAIEQSTDLRQAVDNIRRLQAQKNLDVDKLLIYNPTFAGEVVKELARRFTQGNILTVARELNVPAAMAWVIKVTGGVPEALALHERLFSAVEHNEYAVVAKLLGQRANANEQDQLGNTVLMKAVENNNPHIAALLIRARANVNAQNIQGNTPLIIAILNNNLPIIEMLLQAGANANMPDAIGTTPLMAAAIRDNSAAIIKLFGHGAAVNAQMPDGTTAINIAASRGSAATVQTLLQAGANPYLRDRRGDAIHHAQAGGHQQVLEVLAPYIVNR